MKVFNMGGQEMFLVFLIMFILLGPGRMKEAAKKLARFIRKLVRSETWHQVRGIYSEIKDIPAEIAREVDLEETRREIRADLSEISKDVNHELNQAASEINSITDELDQDVQITLPEGETAEETESGME